MGRDDEVRRLHGLLPDGLVLAAVDPAEVDTARLHPVERTLGDGALPTRRQDLLGGRVAARACLDELGVESRPLRMRDDGAPAWPDSVRGTIAHTTGICLAVVGRSATVSGVGVDVEPARPTPGVVRSLVLTDRESAHAGHDALDPDIGPLAFCAKEAYYKWCRSAGHTGPLDFQDVEVELRDNRLRFVPGDAVTGGLSTTVPGPMGAFVAGPAWVVALVWSDVS
ncbi:MAG: 4'-phosphopantetheinyl transferase superfamily protein [Marmoricola sp.]